MSRHLFDTKLELEQQLCRDILAVLEKGIQNNGSASILFSGGSTPKGLFKQLASSDFNWSKVNVSLVDDRMVPAASEHSNERLLNESFLDEIEGEKPTFYPLVFFSDDEAKNMSIAIKTVHKIGTPDVAVLGMGTDGHFASLFPNDEHSNKGLQRGFESPLLYTNAPKPPINRISLSWQFLSDAKARFLHITGAEKLEIIDNLNARESTLPIDTVLTDETSTTALYWAP